MTEITSFFATFSFAQAILCALLLLPLQQKNPSIRLFVGFMVCVSCYLLRDIFPVLQPYSFFWWLEKIGGNALPGVFWLVSLSVFADHVILKRWQYLVASLTLVIPLLIIFGSLLFGVNINQFSLLGLSAKYGAMALELALVFHALIIAVQHWRDDLVQQRRYIRGGVLSLSAVYIFLVIFASQLLNIQWLMLDVMLNVVMVVLITGVNFLLFSLKDSSLFVTTEHSTLAEKSVVTPSKELIKITQAMEHEKLYQQEGITIASFAKHLAIHEYKLRQLINGELNYRNFNDFLNFYRIQEVSENLVHIDSKNTPVLTLALESGFRSLSSFNKAFKATYGLTPTEYRKKHQ
jgi:AraC-like DNA-binding protein